MGANVDVSAILITINDALTERGTGATVDALYNICKALNYI